MPESRVPVEVLCGLSDNGTSSTDDIYKNDGSISERSSSPKSDSSVSELSETSDASLGLEFSDNDIDSGPTSDILIEEFDMMKLNEDEAEALIMEGADMRHVLKTSWKLQSKYPVGKRILNKSSSLLKCIPGQGLRDMAHAQKMSIVEHERSGRVGFKVRPPPGFERMFFSGSMTAVKSQGPDPILVSYADGSNTLTLADEPLCLHNITVSCAVDSCHVFIQQMRNPTFKGLFPLEQAMSEAFQEEAPPTLLRPIAAGSLLAVFSDEKWYRCQVVSYNEAKDTCDIKFVDHGGYTTVQVSELRPLRSDFVRLPFQATEVYIAHIGSANDEAVIDIASDILFREDVSIQLLGYAEDGVPVIQAYFYQGDYINLFTQEILDDSYKVFLSNHPTYTPVLTASSVMSDTSSTCSEALTETGLPEAEYSTDEGVWSPEASECTAEDNDCTQAIYTPDSVIEYSSDEYSTEYTTENQGMVVYDSQSLTEYAPECQRMAAYTPDVTGTWVPSAATPLVAYCVADPATGLLYYVAAPLVPVPCNQEIYVPQEEESSTAEQSCTTEEVLVREKPFEEWSQEDYAKYYSMD